MASPQRRHAENLRRRRQSGAAFGDAVVEHCRHSAADCDLVDLQAVRLLSNQFAKLVCEFQNLEHAETAAIAGAAATLAAGGLVDSLATAKAEGCKSRILGKIGLAQDALW